MFPIRRFFRYSSGRPSVFLCANSAVIQSKSNPVFQSKFNPHPILCPVRVQENSILFQLVSSRNRIPVFTCTVEVETIRYLLSFFYSLEHNFFIKIIAKSVQFHAKIGKWEYYYVKSKMVNS